MVTSELQNNNTDNLILLPVAILQITATGMRYYEVGAVRDIHSSLEVNSTGTLRHGNAGQNSGGIINMEGYR